MHAPDSPAAPHIEHVALAQQLFAALFAKNGAAVDFRRNLKRNAAWKICLNGAGDDINRRALRRSDEVNACSTRHLRQTLHGTFDFLASHHHEVSHLVNHDNNERQVFRFYNLFFKHRLAAIGVKARLHAAR